MEESKLEIVKDAESTEAKPEVKEESGPTSSLAPNYPATVVEILDPDMKFPKEVLAALKVFKKSKPWRGSYQQKFAKRAMLLWDLSSFYGLPQTQLLALERHKKGFPIDCYMKINNVPVIILDIEKLSVVTLLHEFGHALGKDEHDTVKWSVNLFRRVFPKQFEKLQQETHLLKK